MTGSEVQFFSAAPFCAFALCHIDLLPIFGHDAGMSQPPPVRMSEVRRLRLVRALKRNVGRRKEKGDHKPAFADSSLDAPDSKQEDAR